MDRDLPPVASSAGTPAIELPAFALRRPAGATVTLGEPWPQPGRPGVVGWRRVIDVAGHRDRCADALVDRPYYFDDPLTTVEADLDPITG